MSNWTHIACDIEGDGLVQPSITTPEKAHITRVHCIEIQDLATGEFYSCAQDKRGNTPEGYHSIEDGLNVLTACARVYIHSGIGYDVPALRLIYPDWKIDNEQVVDTLVICQSRFAHQKERDYGMARAHNLPGGLIGFHTLESWGYRLGCHKTEYEGGWETWTEEMSAYCRQDVEVLRALIKYLKRAGWSNDAMRLEHDIAWYLASQQRNGFPFDTEGAVKLQAKLSGIREALRAELVQQFGSWFVRNGKEFTPKRDNAKLHYTKGAVCQKIKEVWFNPGSRAHQWKVLTEQFGWVPEEFTDGGDPKVSETTLKPLEHIPEAAKFLQYLLVDKRLGQISEGKQAWLKHVDERWAPVPAIHHRCRGVGCVTQRGAHSSPNLSQVPRVTNPYGPECRALFGVPPGWTQVGADASGLELRMLGHFLARWDDGAYIKVLLEGDVHQLTMTALGIDDRDIAKTWIYAWLYGGGNEKLGAILLPGGTKEQKTVKGKWSKARFLRTIPALGHLLRAIERKLETQKKEGHSYLIALDGRELFVRHKHAALNTLLQGNGAIVVKKWMQMFDRILTERLGPQGWGGQWCAMMWPHDEVQLAVRHEHVDTVKQILIDTMPLAGDSLNVRCPLAAEAKDGTNWSTTH